jgi:hypothetical protein
LDFITTQDRALADHNVVNTEAMPIYIFGPLLGGVIAGIFGAINDSIHKNMEDDDKNGMTLIHNIAETIQ